MQEDSEVIEGRVKWFDIVKGFGFVTCDTLEGDVLLHANVLRNFGLGSLAEGSAVWLRVQSTPRGMQAVEIVDVKPPEVAESAPLPDLVQIEPETIRALPFVPGRVKWFDKAKGFGFANVFGQPEDVFLHVEVLRCSALAALMPGEAIALKMIKGERGLMAVVVAPWDAAVDPQCPDVE